ncbi:hypothetical protein ColTof4_12147 [Colletotrichum tofieldiae]|uniref:Uncharacterized protein n=1 Tax=Colletotrichum tofieldiae TaxID=708197 RepID=A0A166R5S9_9PEZI|nr:hypothetical protein CT0861_06575 [Colletotrichum tofieldiae]GKT58222.1 hypothetical protein ColTof3_05561 [Colletotrichum tofieldiae]GKT79724.1 hypothetical protein ColTof4_12147 [Colletotrichum tofieldiae]GKT84298.1 hypothetical protein Ct61P_02148 [Colletotrichum tofieldiae]
MAALGFAIDAAGLFASLKLSGAFDQPTPSEAKTNVQIILGNGERTSTAGGPAPHIALWDDNGTRIGQWHPGKKDKIKQGDVKNIVIEHSQTRPKNSQADPYYVMLSQLDDDAICISAVLVANSKISGAFYGDTGYKCGQSWFASENRIGSEFEAPRCVWLDANHDHGINARAISFHLNDMQPNDDKMQQYYENLDTLCKSTPRFSFWGNLLPDAIPPFFKPRLKYKNGNGADEDLTKVLDDPNHPWDKGAYMAPQKVNQPKRRETRANHSSTNRDRSHLIISNQKTNVREICESETSYGWDIVSTRQNVFCDMEHKQLYPLCTNSVITKCFHLEQKTLVGTPGLNLRDEEVQKLRYGRSYNTTNVWKS